jgi:hypothetical protein
MNTCERGCTPESCPPTGGYYVSAIDGPHYYLMAGPYQTHGEALADVDKVHSICIDKDSTGKAHWMGWGTCHRKDDYRKPGKLNQLGLFPVIPSTLFS